MLLRRHPDLAGMDLDVGAPSLEDVGRLLLSTPHMISELGFYPVLSLQPPWKGHHVLIVDAHISCGLKIILREPNLSFLVSSTFLKGKKHFLVFVMLELHISK